MKRLWQSLAVSIVAHVGSAALADEGRLILPDQVDEGVAWVGDAGGLEAGQVLQVFVGAVEACCEGKTPIAGSYQDDGTRVIFAPAFDFIEGQPYTVRTYGAEAALTGFLIAPQSEVASAEVTAIYPSGPLIPENTLRFYVHFSAPMTPHRADEFITLRDAQGTVDPDAFMTFTQELWNADRTRLTLLMDPGRIKRGVAQNRALGPALLEGRRYSIAVKEGWPSARTGQGAPAFVHAFTVSPALRVLPDPGLWQFQRPRVGTLDPLVITFDRPFDQHLAQSAIVVLDAKGARVGGAVSIEDHGQAWRLQPSAPWAGGIQITVDARLEDVAGNNFKDLLDHAVGTKPQEVDQIVIALDLLPPP